MSMHELATLHDQLVGLRGQVTAAIDTLDRFAERVTAAAEKEEAEKPRKPPPTFGEE
jgi:hypothetical protein